jgi:hypothetical protein
MSQFQVLDVNVNEGPEVAEIAKNFEKPIEVIREAIHNSYDAGSKTMRIKAIGETLPNGHRVLVLEFIDDGIGMDYEGLKCFFGLGYHKPNPHSDRQSIGCKGHGTKIYYLAAELVVLTKTLTGDLLLADVSNCWASVSSDQKPAPRVYVGQAAEDEARFRKLEIPDKQGTTIRLIEFTPNSERLIPAFNFTPLENYIRWFTIFGSFEHEVNPASTADRMELFVKATNETTEKPITFGHNLPTADCTDFKKLKDLDARRPTNYFSKMFKRPKYVTPQGYELDMFALIEGPRVRAERDTCIKRQRAGGLYREDERYGIWLCKDYIPVDYGYHQEWSDDPQFPGIADLDLTRALIFVNCQDFSVTANRNSVGNSPDPLLLAAKDACFQFMSEIGQDKDVVDFSNQFTEDRDSREREKDKKALDRRIKRFKDRTRFRIKLSRNRKYIFLEPQREITLYGLIAHLNETEPGMFELEIMDYDDHSGIDMLVKRPPLNPLNKEELAYIELKHTLSSPVNHSFAVLHAIICWEISRDVNLHSSFEDKTKCMYWYNEFKDPQGITHAELLPQPGQKLTHPVKVIALRKLLEEKYGLTKL